MKYSMLLIPFLCVTLLMINGCAPVVVTGAATGAAVATDRRTAGTVVEDQSIELKATNAIHTDEELSGKVHISVVSYNNVVLMVGQAPTKQLRNKAATHVQHIDKVKRIHNEVTIAQPISLKRRSNDAWITTKAKSRLLGTEGVGASRVKVITEDGIVYLMGLVSRSEGRIAAKATQQVSGVKRVVKIFEYTD